MTVVLSPAELLWAKQIHQRLLLLKEQERLAWSVYRDTCNEGPHESYAEREAWAWPALQATLVRIQRERKRLVS